ncbi:ATP-dependent DNA helicase RecG [Thermosyntropha lipolytica DSM 11003]|uniref:ATP-dependent DNA helicase RecG n=1 Tax=Thermosyntropha lipolytica DSM 11003 TaxID=1123382 RepID=A0A1M5P561_9FIRM|nr:ATP-dependent DNA helicase RecG [Thermosyntropha lipolytica]SHG96930.1 ATP-dependent DNA helicase RecG [Thermosyntropha lipolytica DSM 11003]
MEALFREIQYVKGVGPKRSKLFNRLGINTVFDLLWNIPRAYVNHENIAAINDVKIGEKNMVRGRVESVQNLKTGRGMSIVKAWLKDSSGFIQAVWFNQPYMEKVLKKGQELIVIGKVKSAYGGLEIHVSEYEVVGEEEIAFKVVPVYNLTDGLNQKIMRQVMFNVLQEFLPYYPEIFAPDIREKYDLADIKEAFFNIHFPAGREEYKKARKRLAFEELFLFQAGIKQERKPALKSGFVIHKEKNDLVARVYQNIPFALTGAQKRVIEEIFKDMESARQMNRLVQGDVGAGKTVVAALAMAKAVASGYQAAIMAPTEILAEQHYKSILKFFTHTDTVIALLTGSTGSSQRRMLLDALSRGEIDILVGTHALIQEDVFFDQLGLVIIDEQHRFGVKQRALLSQKGNFPDILVMTATPIPRTLALTIYGDLELSVIDELPPGRKPVKTIYVKETFRSRVYDFIKEELEKGRQAYFICPLVEESEKQDLQAAVGLYEELKNKVFTGYRVGLLHGRMKPKEKEYIMENFKAGLLDILVSTTVVEVGVDVPNASVMVIEQAERFGLSQLHQLRGRVGRGSEQAYCFLLGEPKTEEALRRLKAMENTNDGFKLAAEDLLLRGPGDFWGVRQHGLDQLKVADLIRDGKLIESARELARLTEVDDKLLFYINKKFKKEEDVIHN